MAVSYNKLWKMLIDKKMKKKDLQAAADISASVITKLGRDEPVTTTILMKIWVAGGDDSVALLILFKRRPSFLSLQELLVASRLPFAPK